MEPYLVVIGLLVIIVLVIYFVNCKNKNTNNAHTEGMISSTTYNTKPVNDKFMGDRFDFNKTNKRNYLVLFYADWCGHCKNFMPIWDKFAQQNSSHNNFVVQKVSCEQNKQLCQQQKVEGFPTVRFYRADGKVVEYTGDRSMDSLKKFTHDNMN